MLTNIQWFIIYYMDIYLYFAFCSVYPYISQGSPWIKYILLINIIFPLIVHTHPFLYYYGLFSLSLRRRNCCVWCFLKQKSDDMPLCPCYSAVIILVRVCVLGQDLPKASVRIRVKDAKERWYAACYVHAIVRVLY